MTFPNVIRLIFARYHRAKNPPPDLATILKGSADRYWQDKKIETANE